MTGPTLTVIAGGIAAYVIVRHWQYFLLANGNGNGKPQPNNNPAKKGNGGMLIHWIQTWVESRINQIFGQKGVDPSKIKADLDALLGTLQQIAKFAEGIPFLGSFAAYIHGFDAIITALKNIVDSLPPLPGPAPTPAPAPAA